MGITNIKYHEAVSQSRKIGKKNENFNRTCIQSKKKIFGGSSKIIVCD